MTMTKAERLTQRIAEQRAWIAEHGGDQQGYVARYGSIGDLDCYGDGGELIYAADKAALDTLLAQVK